MVSYTGDNSTLLGTKRDTGSYRGDSTNSHGDQTGYGFALKYTHIIIYILLIYINIYINKYIKLNIPCLAEATRVWTLTS